MSKKQKKNYQSMFQGGAFPSPFAPWRAPEKANSDEEEKEKDTQKEKIKENIKSTVKSAWKQKADRKKYTVDNRREQWKQFFDYRMDMQKTFADSLPEDLSSLPPFLQILPVSPKALMEWLKKFQIMANEHFMEQADSVMDFFFTGQEQLFEIVSAAMEKKKEDESAQEDDGTDSAEEDAEAEESPKAVKKPRAKTTQKAGTKTGKKTGTKTGKKTGTRKKSKAAETAEDNAAQEEEAAETVEYSAVADDNDVIETEGNTVESED